MRLSQLSQRAETVLDTVRALAQDSLDARFAEALAWAGAVVAAVESHARDFQETKCWTGRTRRSKLCPTSTRRRPKKSKRAAPATAAVRPSPPRSPASCDTAPPG